MAWVKRHVVLVSIVVLLVVGALAGQLRKGDTASESDSDVNWNAVRADIIEGWPPAKVEYDADEEVLIIEVAPGTNETAGRRVACDIAIPAIRSAGGDPDDTTIAVFEEGSDDPLVVGASC